MISISEDIVDLYTQAVVQLQKEYVNAPTRDELMAFALRRENVETITDEIRGWNELSNYLKQIQSTPNIK